MKLNNQGVRLLKEGNMRDAILAFKGAMYEAHASLMGDDGDGDDDNGYESKDTPSRSFDKQHQQHGACYYAKSPITSITLREASPKASPHNTFSVYQRSFAFDCTCGNVQDDKVLFNSVLLYNIGLAHHRLGVTHIRDSTKNMQEALRYYKCALNMVRQNTLHTTAGDQLFLIVLALLNNMGHVFCHFFREQDAKACRTHLDSLLESSIPVVLTDQDSDFFLLGKFFRSAGHCNAAAAAA